MGAVKFLLTNNLKEGNYPLKLSGNYLTPIEYPIGENTMGLMFITIENGCVWGAVDFELNIPDIDNQYLVISSARSPAGDMLLVDSVLVIRDYNSVGSTSFAQVYGCGPSIGYQILEAKLARFLQ